MLVPSLNVWSGMVQKALVWLESKGGNWSGKSLSTYRKSLLISGCFEAKRIDSNQARPRLDSLPGTFS